MTKQTIQSQDMNVAEVFQAFYAVPDYQREYVWETEQVERLLDDINGELADADLTKAPEYFIGSIVVCPGENGVWELIDGQQRMTTLFLILCAIRDLIGELGETPPGALNPQIAATSTDISGRDHFRYRLDLQYEDSGDVLVQIAERKPRDRNSAATRSITNILNAYDVSLSFLKREFGENVASVRGLYGYLTNNVKVIRIQTEDVAKALKIFETINDRGVGLDSMDLLKNLMFMQAKREQFEQLKIRWKTLVDILFGAQEKPLRFLRYFIFSEYHVDRLREDEIYEWFLRNEPRCGYKKAPLAFVDKLLSAARAYANFLEGKDAHGTLNRYLANIGFMSGAARQHLILLLAGRHLPKELFTELCRQVENLFFAYIVTREPTREFERLFTQWAQHLRKVSDGGSLRAFLDGYFMPAKQSLAARFELAFKEMGEWSLQKYRLRYVLAKLTQYVNESAWGSSGAQVDLGNFIHGKVEIEHILPQQPSAEVKAAFDKPDAMGVFIFRLGNLTLVEKSINCSVGNGLFAAKRTEYFKSNFLLTKSLGGNVAVGKDTAVSRAVKDLLAFEEWTSRSIENRQSMLTRLAARAWDMPIAEE